MNHARALCDAAHFAFNSAYFEADGNLLRNRVGRHYRLRRLVGVVAQPRFQSGYAGSYRSDVQRLADNACRSDDDVGGLYSEHGREQVARALGYLNAVRVAGVRVSAVAYDRLRLAVSDMIFCDDQRRALDKISCIDSRRVGDFFAVYEREIALRPVLAYAAVNAGSLESLCGADAARYYFHFILPPQISSPKALSLPMTRFRFSSAAPDAPLPRLSYTAVSSIRSSLP